MAVSGGNTGGGKTDMDRIGLFSEMGYVSIGDKYPHTHLYFRPFNIAAYKNRQMLPGGSKSRSATQAGYFEKEFKRIMEKEAYSNYAVLRRQDRNRAKDRDLDGPFSPSAPGKLPSGLGSYYGTFSGVVEAFSPLTHPRKGYKAPGKNVMTNPGKKGTGYGYANVLIGKMPEHSYDSYSAGREAWSKVQAHHKQMLRGGEFKLNLYPLEYFDKNPYFTDKAIKVSMRKVGSETKRKDFGPFKPSSPGKRMGGCKAGTFSTYPVHSTDPYKVVKKPEQTRNKYGKIYLPNSGPKSKPISSIITTNVNRSVNIDNYKTISRVTGY